MIIEFAGPPGTGKTTAVSALASILKGRACSISSRRELGRYGIRYVVAAPRRFISLVSATVRENWRTPRLLRYKLALLAGAVARTERARVEGRGNLVLLDEGLAQYAFVLPEREFGPGELQSFFRRFVRCDALIVVLADAATRKARMAKRGRIPRSALGIDQEAWQTLIESNARLINDVTNAAFRIIVVSGDMGPEELARTIAARLASNDPG